jgi:hypothetical protein
MWDESFVAYFKAPTHDLLRGFEEDNENPRVASLLSPDHEAGVAKQDADDVVVGQCNICYVNFVRECGVWACTVCFLLLSDWHHFGL